LSRDLTTLVADSTAAPWSGRVWRCHHRSRAALNADGSLGGVGGRFNSGIESVFKPPFRVLYTSIESAAALLEVIRHLGYRSTDARAVVALEDVAMRVLSQIDVALQRVFDWSREATLLANNASYGYTQQLAAEAFRSGAEGILVPSSTGIDANLVIFVDNVAEDSHADLVRQIGDIRPILTTLVGGA
ncbi:MAG TPA: RES family NAD+ phosphorylase, partial [Thermoanaerobaculia bacterium]